MSSRLKLAGICFAAAFALAACGGGGGTTSMAPSEPPAPTEPPPPPGPTAESIKADAADAITAAATARIAAEQAKKDAAKYAGMLTAESVNGDSAMAIANAEMILDAEMAAKQAAMDADEALQDAMAAKMAAEGLPEDDAERAGAIAAAEQAIEQATAQKKAAMGIVDETGDGTLKASVAMVKGDNPLLEGYPTMPAAFGKDVATSVKMALATTNITRIATLDALTAATVPMHATRMNDASDIEAMTWAMIVGEDNIMMQRIGESNAALPVASIAGMMASAVDKTATTAALSATGGSAGDGKYPDGAAVGDATVSGTPGTEYKGIPGAVWCLGGTGGCSVNADGTLSDGWYFTPTAATELYVANPQMAGMYMVATMYARYGYWLSFNPTGTDPVGAANAISIGASIGHSTTNTGSLNLTRPASAAEDVTARYSGKAAGISARGDASGHFTANVSLTATFGAAIADSNLSGYISGFDGNAVNPNWRVTLNESSLTEAAALGTGATDGIAYGGAAAGAWTAQGYGPAPIDPDGGGPETEQNQRPAGFFGTFNANFTDGMAAGAYATRAD